MPGLKRMSKSYLNNGRTHKIINLFQSWGNYELERMVKISKKSIPLEKPWGKRLVKGGICYRLRFTPMVWGGYGRINLRIGFLPFNCEENPGEVFLPLRDKERFRLVRGDYSLVWLNPETGAYDEKAIDIAPECIRFFCEQHGKKLKISEQFSPGESSTPKQETVAWNFLVIFLSIGLRTWINLNNSKKKLSSLTSFCFIFS